MARGFLRYKAYPFMDKDPVIDVARTVKRDKGMSDREIFEAGGPAVATLRGWFVGKTRRPQFATVAASFGAMGLSSIPITSEGRNKLKGR